MFTGIVQGLCPVSRVVDEASIRRLTVDLGELGQGLQLGASVAINGTCLTATGVAEGKGTCNVAFDVIKESLTHTNLGNIAEGSLVNVERSFHVGDEVGGHILSGHVSGRVQIAAIEAAENERNLHFDVPERWMKYLHHKGFVALDGASLTIASVDVRASQISVSLIPETIERTTLGSADVGDWVNLEVDAQTQAVVETVERLFESPEWRARFSAG
ncbi:MAG: riboflavin synthase subunit alpha [Gammaproteobacteria bacterium]|nr:riboflavin synthase subunit alpha [Gammaproteobacteria bacterium]